MASHHSVSRVDDKNLLELLQKLEARTTRIESHLGLTTTAASLESPVPEPELSGSSREPDRESGLELNFGEFGLAWFGSIVLLLGIAFLMTYISGLGHRNLAGAFGFVAAGGLYLTGRIWRQTVTYLSDLTINGSLVILYYATLRLHYFSPIRSSLIPRWLWVLCSPPSHSSSAWQRPANPRPWQASLCCWP